MDTITTVLVHLNDDDNAFAVLDSTARAMREAGIPDSFIDAYTREARAGDFQHSLATTKRYVIVIGGRKG